jgi:hypothetical protein
LRASAKGTTESRQPRLALLQVEKRLARGERIAPQDSPQIALPDALGWFGQAA